MITDADVERIPGATVYGNDGEKIGKAGAVYRDDQSGRPDWMTVQTGLFGTSESFVPLAQADLDGDDVRVPYAKAQVKDAPRVDSEGHLDISEEDRLFEHYGMAGSGHQAAGQGQDHREDHGDEHRDEHRDEQRADSRSDQRDDQDDRRGVMGAWNDDRHDDRHDDRQGQGRDEEHDQRVREAAASAAPTGGRHEGTRDLDLDRGDAGRADRRADRREDATASATATDSGRREGLRDSDDSGLWRSSDDTHRAERSGDDRREEPRGDHRLSPVDLRDGSREGSRDDTDRGRTTERSGLSSSPVSGAAVGAAGSTGQRKPRLSQWVLVERTAIIEISDEDAQRLTGDASGTTDLRSTQTRADR